MVQGFLAMPVGDRFSPVSDLVAGWAEAHNSDESLGVRGIIVVPDFIGLDGPLASCRSADRAAFSACVIDAGSDAIPLRFGEESAQIAAP